MRPRVTASRSLAATVGPSPFPLSVVRPYLASIVGRLVEAMVPTPGVPSLSTMMLAIAAYLGSPIGALASCAEGRYPLLAGPTFCDSVLSSERGTKRAFLRAMIMPAQQTVHSSVLSCLRWT